MTYSGAEQSGTSYTIKTLHGYWHDTVVCLSVSLSATKCIVAKRYILQQKCLNK